jgi:hypothetical protein
MSSQHAHKTRELQQDAQHTHTHKREHASKTSLRLLAFIHCSTEPAQVGSSHAAPKQFKF